MIHPLFFLSHRVRHRGTLQSSTEYVVGIAIVIIILSTLFLFGLSSFYNNTAESTTWMKPTTITSTITTTTTGGTTTTITSTITTVATTSALNPMTINWGPIATGIFVGLIGIAIAICVLSWFMKLPNER